MASCPDADSSWVLAGSEVGKAGLGTTGRGFLQDWAAIWVCPFLGPGGHLHHLLQPVRGTLGQGKEIRPQESGIRTWTMPTVVSCEKSGRNFGGETSMSRGFEAMVEKPFWGRL